MSSEEKVVRKGITIKSLVLGGIIMAISYLFLFYSFHPRVAGANYWFNHYFVYFGLRWSYPWETFFFPMVIIMSLLALLSRKLRVTPQEWTIVYAIVSMVVPTIFWWGVWIWNMNPLCGTSRFKSILEYCPSIWIPKDYDILAKFYESRNPWEFTIPYAGSWTVPIITWILFYIFSGIWLYALALIFRKRFIEVEKLPYPGVIPSITIVNFASTPVSETSRRSILWSKKARLFWIGFLIGVFYAFFYIQDWWPYWFFKKPPFTIKGDISFQGKFPPFQRSVLSYSVLAMEVALFFLFSLDILFTATIFHIIFLILLPAYFVSTGVFPSKETSEWGAMWGIYYQSKYGYAGTYGMALNTMTIGIALYLIFYTRDYWIRLFKGFLGKEKVSEEGEPCSIRTMWILFILGFILMWAWMIASEIHPIASLAGLIYIGIVWFAVIRFRGEAWNGPILPWGFRLQGPDRAFAYGTGATLGLWKWGEPAHSTTGYGLAFTVSNFTTYQIFTPAVSAIYSYKMAAETKTDPREIFKVQLPLIIIVAILSVTIGWYNMGLQGLRNWSHSWTQSWDGALNNGMGAANSVVNGRGEDPIRANSMIIGIVIGAILMFLRTRFAWFIINPIAVPLLTLTNFYSSLSAIIAFILKLLVVKIGGAKVYENYAVPIAVGVFYGSFIMWHILLPLSLQLSLGWKMIPV